MRYATQQTAKSDIGTFVISRKLEETKQIADLLHFNPDKLNPSQLSAVAKGVKTHPILNIEHSEHKVDATLAKINLRTFVYKLLIREVAGVNQWEESADVKHLIQNASHKVDQHFKATIGINSCLMKPGNYARILFDPQNESKVVFLLGTEEKKNNFTDLLSKLQFMHKIFSRRSPKLKYPSEWNHYKQVAVEFGNILLNNYPYAHWSNYVHKCIEHVQEVIETDDTLGGLSGEGNEAGNKIFRHLRKNHSRKGSTLHSVTDVLKVHWLYCSRKLRKLSHVSRRKYKCSLCNQMGHNCMSCPAKSS